jgi:rhodanese-related sulfurtransferase
MAYEQEEEEEHEIRSQLYEQFALIAKAFGSARRLTLIEILAQAEYTVERLAEEAEISVANTSQHLKTLREVRLVKVRRDGVVAYYRLTDEGIFQTWQMIRELGERHNAEIDRLANRLWLDRDPQLSISFEDLMPLLEEDSLIILDVRPEREFWSGHITGAICIPLPELPGRLPEISKNRKVIVYCRGPYSTLSDKAVRLLDANGYHAKRLELGLPEWRLQGLPVSSQPREMLPAS